MENYRKTIQKRLYVYVIYCSNVFLVNTGMNLLFESNPFSSFMSGLTIALQLVLLFKIGMYYKALQEEKFLKTLQIKESDERKQCIRTKAQSTGLLLSLLLMLIAMLLASFLNVSVFLTLFVTCLACCGITLLCKIYYAYRM